MGTMRINGVTFIESEVVKLSLDEFVAQNIDVFWKDISRERRKSRLVSVYFFKSIEIAKTELASKR